MPSEVGPTSVLKKQKTVPKFSWNITIALVHSRIDQLRSSRRSVGPVTDRSAVSDLSQIQAANQVKRVILRRLRRVPPREWPELGTEFFTELGQIPLEDPAVFLMVVVDLAEEISSLPSSALFDKSADFIERVAANGRVSGGEEQRTIEWLESELRDWLEQAGPPTLATRVYEYVESHLQDQLTVPVIARAVGCSEKRLSAAFKQETSLTVRQYVTQERMRRANELLQQGEKVEVVMLLVGYRNKTHFYEKLAHYAGAEREDFGHHPLPGGMTGGDVLATVET